MEQFNSFFSAQKCLILKILLMGKKPYYRLDKCNFCLSKDICNYDRDKSSLLHSICDSNSLLILRTIQFFCAIYSVSVSGRQDHKISVSHKKRRERDCCWYWLPFPNLFVSSVCILLMTVTCGARLLTFIYYFVFLHS